MDQIRFKNGLRWLEYQELRTDIDSGVTSTDIFGANNNNLTYIGSQENLLATEINTPDLSAIVKDDRNIIDVFDKGLAGFSGTRALFTQDDELDPTDIVEGGSNPEQKKPRQWRDYAAPRPTTLSIFIPSRRPRRPGLASIGCPIRRK